MLKAQIGEYVEELARALNAQEEDIRFAALHNFLTLSSIIDKYLELDMRDQPITLAAFNVLHLLILNNGTMMPTEISVRTWRTKHAVTKLIDTLENLGLVKRLQIESGDRRVRKVTITEKGLDLVNKFSINTSGRVNRHVFRSLDDTELGKFNSILSSLKNDIIKQIQDFKQENS